MLQAQRPQADAELVLAVPDMAAQAHIHAQLIGARAQAAAFRQLQPLANVFLDAYRHTEVGPENAAQAIRIAGLGGEVAAVVQLGGIRQRALITQRRGAAPAQGGQAGGPVVVIGPVMADRRPRFGPGPVEQAQQTVMKDIEKALAGAVGIVALALAHVLGQV
ncbi:hypothetical protein UB48_26320 [Pseudomonas sp. 2(2015)]|nr:hypothetical protein UB48_26320 [Pseudomonas sp. 2(2015)]